MMRRKVAATIVGTGSYRLIKFIKAAKPSRLKIYKESQLTLEKFDVTKIKNDSPRIILFDKSRYRYLVFFEFGCDDTVPPSIQDLLQKIVVSRCLSSLEITQTDD